MWLIQWAPGASLAGWALAVVVLQRLGRDGNGLTFILLGMFAGSALWAAVAVCSLPLFFLIRPLVDPLAREATRLRAAILAAAGADSVPGQSPSSAGGYSAHSTRVENLRPDSTSLLSWRCASRSASERLPRPRCGLQPSPPITTDAHSSRNIVTLRSPSASRKIWRFCVYCSSTTHWRC